MFVRSWLLALATCFAGAAIATFAATAAPPAQDATWWKHAMIYEIYHAV